MGATASSRNLSGYLANSLTQKDLTEGSVKRSTTFFLYSLSAKILLIPKRVDPGYSNRAKTELCKIYSILALQTSGHIFLNTPIKPEATKCRYSGSTCSTALNAIGASKSAGLKYIKSFILSAGTKSSIFSANS